MLQCVYGDTENAGVESAEQMECGKQNFHWHWTECRLEVFCVMYCIIILAVFISFDCYFVNTILTCVHFVRCVSCH